MFTERLFSSKSVIYDGAAASGIELLPPDVDTTEVLLIDPMLATGGSAVAAISYLKKAGVTNLRFVCLVAAPDGTVDGSGNRFWNATDACCDFLGKEMDDVGYISELIADMAAMLSGPPWPRRSPLRRRDRRASASR